MHREEHRKGNREISKNKDRGKRKGEQEEEKVINCSKRKEKEHRVDYEWIIN